MCFHGRSRSLEACDSGAATGAGSAGDEIELEDMLPSENRNRKRRHPIFYKSPLARNESHVKAFTLAFLPQGKTV